MSSTTTESRSNWFSKYKRESMSLKHTHRLRSALTTFESSMLKNPCAPLKRQYQVYDWGLSEWKLRLPCQSYKMTWYTKDQDASQMLRQNITMRHERILKYQYSRKTSLKSFVYSTCFSPVPQAPCPALLLHNEINFFIWHELANVVF